MTRLLRAFTLTAALLGLLAIVACGDDEGGGPSPPAVGEGTPTAQVTPTPTPGAGEAIEMGIDPETTGNTCGPSPGDCTLGAVEQCYEVTCPSEECSWDGTSSFDGISDYVIDVYVDDPAGSVSAPFGYDAWVHYDNAIVNIAAPGTDGKIRIPGADFGGGDEIALPDSDGKFIGGWMFFTGTPDVGVNTYIGDGPLLRLGLDIGAAGVVTFTFDQVGSGYLSTGPGGWSDVQSHPLIFRTAQLAINQACAED